MADINLAFNKVIKPDEGFYSNDKNDSGGETVWGFARNKNPAAPVWPLVDAYKRKPGFPQNMRNDNAITNMIISLYKTNYWNPLRLDEVNDQTIANALFDISVNCGQQVASKFLQRALNVFNHNGLDYPDLLVDGSVGPKTISTLNNFRSPDKILKAIDSLQGNLYITITEANKKDEEFMNGWIERVEI